MTATDRSAWGKRGRGLLAHPHRASQVSNDRTPGYRRCGKHNPPQLGIKPPAGTSKCRPFGKLEKGVGEKMRACEKLAREGRATMNLSLTQVTCIIGQNCPRMHNFCCQEPPSSQGQTLLPISHC